MTGIPPLGRAILAAHALWGAVLLLAYHLLGDAAQVARPLLVAVWFGTTAMLLVFGMVVASAGWRRNETRYLGVLLVFDLASIAIVVELLRVA